MLALDGDAKCWNLLRALPCPTTLGALYREDARRLVLKVFRAALRLEFKDKVASVDLA